MKTTRTSRSDTQEYVIAFRTYVQADGGLVVAFGNQRLELSPDEIHALLLGTLDYAKVFSKLNDKIDTTLTELSESDTTLEIASQNGKM